MKSSRKERKKRRKKDESDGELDDSNRVDSDCQEETPRGGRGRAKGRGRAAATPNTGNEQMPTVAEVCESFGLNDVELEYSEADYQNLTTYKLFQQHVRPLLAKENPRVPVSKLMMLVAAKWREFSAREQQQNGDHEDDNEEEEEQGDDDQEEQDDEEEIQSTPVSIFDY